MQKEIIVFPGVEKIATYIFNLLLQKSLHTAEGEFITVALSGGSTPKQIFNYVSANDKGQINWNKIKLFWGDERCVSPAHDDSNFRMTKQSLLDNIPIPAENIFRIWGENIPKLEAMRYSAVLTDNVKSENGLPKFDIFLLGMGEDGHTASIFPGNESLFQSTNICEAVIHPQTQQQRLTITGPVINNAATIVFLVTGAGKAAMAGWLLNHYTETKLPAAFVNPVHGKLFWLLDEKAAILLTAATTKYLG
jgi:6-phosphogluconolactonase